MSAHDLKKNNDVHDKSFIINTATFCKKKKSTCRGDVYAE